MAKLTKRKQDELIDKEIKAWEEIFEDISDEKKKSRKETH